MIGKSLQPLARRLPLLLTTLLAVIVSGVSWTAYLQIKRAALETSRAHVESAAHQVATMLDGSLLRVRTELRGLANDRRLGAALLSAPRPDTAALRGVLTSFRAQHPQFVILSVWTPPRKLLATTGSDSLAAIARAPFATAGAGDGWRVSPIRAVQGVDQFSVVAPVVARGIDTVGYVVGARAFSDSGSAKVVARLIGPGSRFLLGNLSGNLWTNLATRVSGPPLTALHDPRPTFTDAAGQRYVGGAASLGGAPWLVWVDVPEVYALGAARRFLAEILVAGVVFLMVGAVGAWLISRDVVGRLAALRRASDVVAMGLSPDPLVMDTCDEIGALARSFYAMSERIYATKRELVDRAADLERRNEQLQQSEFRYRQLIDQSPDAVVVHRRGAIVFTNAMAERMFGASDARPLVGLPLLKLVDAADHAVVRQRLHAVETSGEPSRLTEMRLRRLDGTPFVAEVNGTPITFDGEPAIQTLARDISERRMLEDSLRQSQKMEAVGRLAGGFAHDFNNLLTVISSYVELSLARMGSDDPLRPDLEEIRRAGISAAKLTRQMLAFSRKQALAPRAIDVNGAITGLTAMLTRVLGAQIAVATDLRPGLGRIFADAGQLEQVLMNLAVNARDAMPDGGTLRIETAELDLAESTDAHRRSIPPGQYVVLTVSDSGVGMTPEVQAHIFEPFYTTKQPGQGTGLGLATVYGIVQQSGGYVWVYSEPGRGTSFKVFFPVHDGATDEPTKMTGEFAIPRQDAATILLVEDDPTVRGVVRRILDRSPHRVCEAGSGSAALEIFRAQQGRVDLVITDMMMPGMTGAELVRELREWQPQLRAIIMSGYSEEATKRDWRLPESALFLEKPISPSQLTRAIGEALGSETLG